MENSSDLELLRKEGSTTLSIQMCNVIYTKVQIDKIYIYFTACRQVEHKKRN